MTSPARAGRTLVAAKPTAVARNALPKLVGPSGSSRYCQRQARITRFRNMVRSDSVSQSNRAWTISRATPRRSTLYNTRPSNAAASASTIKVRKCDRMNDRSVPYYTALARSTRVRRYMLLLSAWKHPCKMRGSASEGNVVAARCSRFEHDARSAPAGSPRESPRHLRLGRSPADRRDRSHFRVRLRAWVGNPRQRQGSLADFGVLVRPHAADCPESRALD